MKRTWIFGAGTLALALAAAPAHAQNDEGRKAGDVPGPIDSLSDLQDTGRMVFKMADENNDGQISQKEAVDAANLVAGGFFFRADQNGDGVLSQDEMKQAREAFLSTKPWLRYAMETAKAQRGQAGANPAQPGAPTNTNANAAGNNPFAALSAAFDSNSDKQLQAAELRQAVQTAVQGAFAQADTDRNGQLSTSEVNAAAAGVSRTVAQAAFQQADTDNNGQISQAEFEKAIVQPARTVFAIMDLNHDGQISQQEAQTARQVIASKVRALNLPEAPNSPRNAINSTLSTPAQPTAPPAAANPGR